MADLSTSYMGLKLNNPVVIAACSLSGRIDNIRQAEELGAGAMVLKSLFEEQVLHEEGELRDIFDNDAGAGQEADSFFPEIETDAASQHLKWIERTRKEVKMPLIGSINAVSPGKWTEYAKRLEETGVDALELNMYAVESDLETHAESIEKRLLDTVNAVRETVSLPLAVKISPFYTSVANVVKKIEEAGASGVVLFNRFFQPEIDPDTERLFQKMSLSTASEMRVPLRWTALLYGRVGLDLIGNTGVQNELDIVKFMLAGSTAVQVAGALYRNKLRYIAKLVSGVSSWMETKDYSNIDDFRGLLSQQNHTGNTAVFERAQYLNFLLKSNGESVAAND